MKHKSSCRLFFSIVCLTGLLFAACGQTKPKKEEVGLKIVTSFYPIYALTKIVSGDLNSVKMIQSGQGIHGFEPSANDIAAIYDADVFIYHSHTLESWARALEPNLQGSSVRVLEATEGMVLDKVKGLEDIEAREGMDESTLYDPHMWNDPLKAAEEAKVIADQLAKIDPDNASVYQKNAQQFQDEAKQLVAKYQPQFKKAKSKHFVTSHTAFSYLAKQFGLEQLGIAGISTEQEPTSRQLAEIEEFVKAYQVKTIFVEQGVSPKIAETIASATGAKIAELSPLEIDPQNGKTYLENLEKNLEILVKTLNQ
ncbi:metal ABC transporter solute-binding protein, Zn/Mn family [Streptococcus merionis]|uniref:metal ABC transporter solute-binding protein, Zn/Mn family n=1 Tax=Streptococcus merionis TaxID=400065 RepID=UPI003519CB60